MKTRILLPTDFSAYANAAAGAAEALSRKLDAQLFFLHCLEGDTQRTKLDSRAVEINPANSVEGQLAQRLFDRLLFEQRIKPGIANLHIVTGDVVTEIAVATRNLAIDYVFMGAHGATDLKESLIGSKAEQVIRQLEVPVVLFQKTFRNDFERVLFLSDFAEEAEPSFLETVEFCRLIGAELVMGSVDLPGFFSLPNFFVKKSMASFRSRIEGVPCQMVMQQADRFEEGVRKLVDKQEIDLVVIPSHRRSKFSQLIYESFSTSLVGEITTPIMTMLI